MTGGSASATLDTAARGGRGATGVGMERLSRAVGGLSCLFGYVLVALSVLVAVETLGRKLLGFSLQGVDELGGYVLAFGSSLAFSAALVARGHIRIDIFHLLLPRPAQALLNWLAVLLMGAFATLLVIVCARVIEETIEFRSTAPTPWATPLIWPQSLWYGALVIFAVVAVAAAVHASLLFLSGRWQALARDYGPKLTTEEVEEELADAKRR